jgi:hypothetical protein
MTIRTLADRMELLRLAFRYCNAERPDKEEVSESGCGLSSDASNQIATSHAAIMGDHPVAIDSEVSGESFAHSA